MITLLELKTQVRNRADMSRSKFIEDSELTYYINNSYKELYDILTTAYEDYYMIDNPPVYNLSGGVGQDFMTLPADFYKLRGVDLSLDAASTWTTLSPFTFNRRNRQGQLWYQFTQLYRLVGDRVYITPSDNAAGIYRLWYIPRAPDLVNDTDLMDGVNGWDEYVVVDAAIKCKEKEESDTSTLERQKANLLMRITNASKNRDAGLPETISDISLSDYESRFPWGAWW